MRASAPEPVEGTFRPVDRDGAATVPPVPLRAVLPAIPVDGEESGGPGLVVVRDGPPPTDEALPAEEDLPEDDQRARAFLAGGAYATVAIDRYDDLPSIFGKIDAAASPRVALVAARGNQELQRALSMRRLQRHLDLHGKDLILVTRSRALRLRAREEALPAVGTLGRVDFQRDGRRGVQLGWLTLRLPSLGALLGVVVLIAALLAGLAGVVWYLPEAELTLYLPAAVQEERLDLTLDGQSSAVNLEKMTVPARRREVSVTRSFFRPATGVVQIPTNHAGVGLRFTNRTNAAVRVPKGTVVIAANNVRFTVADDVNLPRLNATGEAIALAQQPGTVGNVAANSIARIEGDLGPRVAVTNPAPGEKGTDTPQQVVNEQDVEGVRAFAEPVLIDAARQDLLQRLGGNTVIVTNGATGQISEIVATPPTGVPGKYTEVKVTGKVSLLTVDDAHLRELYVGHFRPRIAQEQMLLEDEFTTTVERAGDMERAFDRLPVTVRVQAKTAPLLDRRQLQAAVAGKSEAGAERAIRERLITPTPPLIDVSPGWAPRLPRRPERITIAVAPATP